MLQPPGFGTKPHLITIIMDDFGWNSVGFHGHNPEIQTPTMDALALSGLRLDRHCEAAAHLCPRLHPTHCHTDDLVWISGSKRNSPFERLLVISTAREIASPAIVCSSRPAGARPPREPCAPAR
jgi:hypothetical protein